MEIVVNIPRIPTKGRISRLKDGKRAAVEVGHIIYCRSIVAGVDSQHGGPAAATAWRTGSAPRVSRGTARGRPSLCTSVTVIGLNLAAPNS
eukprot:scaffold1640_cov111-Isochrysis_galbana.AAC.10